MFRVMAGNSSDVDVRTGSSETAICNEGAAQRSQTTSDPTSPPPPPPPVPEPMDHSVGGGSSHPCEAPPSYEQSLGHQRLEYASCPANSNSNSQLPPSYRRESHPYGDPHLPAPAVPDQEGPRRYSQQRPSVWTSDVETPNVATEDTLSTMTERELEETCVKMTLPPMHMSMAVTCLVLNFLIPGLGTMLAAAGVFCCTRNNEWTHEKKCGSCSLNLCIGLTQLLLTPFLLIGWVWSILWGFAFVGISQQHYHGPKRQGVAPYDIHSVVAQGPPSYSQVSLREPTSQQSTTESDVTTTTTTTAANNITDQQQVEQQQYSTEPRLSIVEVHVPAISRTGGSDNSRDAVHPRAPVSLAPNEQTNSAPQTACEQQPAETASSQHDRNISMDCSDSRTTTSSGTRRNSVTHDLGGQTNDLGGQRSGEMIDVSN